MGFPGIMGVRRSSYSIGLIIVLFLMLCLIACGGTASTMSIAQLHARIVPPRKSSANRKTFAHKRYLVNMHFNIPYGPLAGERLDLCTPQSISTPHPGVLLIHGGGWVGGDKVYYDSLCSSLASYGFITASINYRLAPRHIWPAQLVDAQLAVRWLRSQAPQFRLDPRRLCAFGRSAGGHLAIFLGVLSSIHPGDEAKLLTNESPKVSCVVDEFGPTDLATMLSTKYQRSIISALLAGATVQKNPALYRDASPLFDVSSLSAPMIIVQGTQDVVVPASQSLALEQKLQQAHVPVQYISYKGDHAFSGLNQQQQNIISEQVDAYLTTQEQP